MLYVDDFADSLQFLSGSQLEALPYAYTGRGSHFHGRRKAAPRRRADAAARRACALCRSGWNG